MNKISVKETKIKEIVYDFSIQLEELDKALLYTKNSRALANNVKKKGFFGAMFGGISGGSDKELAQSITQLGLGLETTQKIVEVLLQISNAKNYYLKGFHEVLVKKIKSLNNDLIICDDNQKNSKEATIIIAKKLKSQIEDKLEQSELLTSHQIEIVNLKSENRNKTTLDQQQTADIFKLKNNLDKKNTLDNEQQIRIQDLERSLYNLEKRFSESNFPSNTFTSRNILLIISFLLSIVALIHSICF